MSVNFIWMQCRNRVIGVDGQLPVHITGDLKQFREKTQGSIVVMGRKTWESLPERYHDPLAKRINIVLTTQRNYHPEHNATVIHDLPTFLKENVGRDIWIAGGAEIYFQFMCLADQLHVTDVDMTIFPKGVVCTAPTIDPQQWSLSRRSAPFKQRLPNGREVNYTFKVYNRK